MGHDGRPEVVSLAASDSSTRPSHSSGGLDAIHAHVGKRKFIRGLGESARKVLSDQVKSDTGLRIESPWWRRLVKWINPEEG
jgi:hypothetical protein